MKILAAILSGIIAALFSITAVFSVFSLLFELLESRYPEDVGGNPTASFITLIVSGLVAWFFGIWIPRRLFRPTNLHPKVLARLAK